MATETGMVIVKATGTGTVKAMDMARRNTGTLTVRKELLVDMGTHTEISRREGLRGTITSMTMKSARTLIFSPGMQRLSFQITWSWTLSHRISMFGPHSLAMKTYILIQLLPNCSPESKGQ